MRIAIVLVLSLMASAGAAADGAEEAAVYVDFERSYFANDARAMNRWITRDAELVQTLHVPDRGSSSMWLSRSQLTSGMRASRPRPASLLTSLEDVRIEPSPGGGFCGQGGSSEEVVIEGTRYSEREERRFCFKEDRGRPVMYRGLIDVYYEPIVANE